MSLETPNFKSNGDIYPCRFVASVLAKDFYVQEAAASTVQKAIVGISDESSRDGREDVDDLRHAKAEDPCRVHGQGSSPVLLEMAATCTAGQLLKPNSTTDGKGIPVDETSSGGYQFYGAKALEQCTASGQKIHVQVMFGQVHY